MSPSIASRRDIGSAMENVSQLDLASQQEHDAVVPSPPVWLGIHIKSTNRDLPSRAPKVFCNSVVNAESRSEDDASVKSKNGKTTQDVVWT